MTYRHRYEVRAMPLLKVLVAPGTQFRCGSESMSPGTNRADPGTPTGKRGVMFNLSENPGVPSQAFRNPELREQPPGGHQQPEPVFLEDFPPLGAVNGRHSVSIIKAVGSYGYIDELREKLLNDEIIWEDVLNKVHGSKPWTKATWKQRRAQIIGDTCGACGSTTPPLVLQHIWHPDPFAQCCEQVKAQLLETTDYVVRHPFPEEPPPFDPETAPPQPFERRPSCPRCGSVNIRQRRNGSWACNYQYRRRRCSHEFQEPVVTDYRKFDEAGWLSHLESQHRWETGEKRRDWWQRFREENRAAILKGAALLTLEQHRRYVELKEDDVVTRCKKCAFLEDKAFTSDYRSGVLMERRRGVTQSKEEFQEDLRPALE